MTTFDANADYCYVTTVGRNTGQAHTIEIWFAAVDETLYVLAGRGEGADFVRNARKTPAVTVRVGERSGTEHNATARIVTEQAEDTLARRVLLAKYASHDELDEWGRTALPIAFDLLNETL